MKPNKQFTVLALSLLACTAGFAQEYGRVLSSVAQVQQISVPRKVCSTEQVTVQDPKSGAGAALGAIAGGAMGNQLGRGAGNAVATMLGIVGGAVIGDRFEGPGSSHVDTVQHCGIQNFTESKVVGYNVLYEYAGKQYQVQMPNDPGSSIPLQVTPIGGMPTQSAPSYAPQSYVEPTAPAVTYGYEAPVTERYVQDRYVPARYVASSYSPGMEAAQLGLVVGAGALVGYGLSNGFHGVRHWR